MNKRLLSVSLTLPILLLEVGQSLADSGSSVMQMFVFSRPDQRTSQVTLDRQQFPVFFLSARKQKPTTCRWAGYCDDEDNNNNVDNHGTSAIAWQEPLSVNDHSTRTMMTYGTRSTEIL